MVIRGDERAAPTLERSAATPAVDARRSIDQTHHGEACRPVVKVAANGIAPFVPVATARRVATVLVVAIEGKGAARRRRTRVVMAVVVG